jgi:hypothetical protein
MNTVIFNIDVFSIDKVVGFIFKISKFVVIAKNFISIMRAIFIEIIALELWQPKFSLCNNSGKFLSISPPPLKASWNLRLFFYKFLAIAMKLYNCLR